MRLPLTVPGDPAEESEMTDQPTPETAPIQIETGEYALDAETVASRLDPETLDRLAERFNSDGP